MNGDLIFCVFAALIPPIWLVIGLVGLALRTKARRSEKDAFNLLA